MRIVLAAAAVGESTTGLALVLVPSVAGQLLLGVSLAGAATPVARVAGMALIGLGIACWPGPPRTGMLIYSALVTLYLAYLALVADFGGVLLWPAVVLHAVLVALLAKAPKRASELK